MKSVTKKRSLLITATLFAAVLGGAVLAGCTGRGGMTLDDLEKSEFTCAVTFDTAGGYWASGGAGASGEDGEETVRMEERRMYLKPGSTLNRAKAEEFAKTVREGFTFNTYCTAITDDAGNVTYAPWDYSKPVNENITLYARWMENYSIIAHYGENFSKEKRFNVPQNSDGVAQAITSMDFSTENVTVLAMYDNEDKTGEPIIISRAEPYTPPCTAENKVYHVYVETLEGIWTLVRTKDDFKINAGSRLYLLADINLEGAMLDIPSIFLGKINGKGHTVENFKVEQRAVDRNDSYFGLFKEMQGDAEIRDIHFKDVTYKAALGNPQVREYSAGILAGRVSERTIIENVTVTGTFQFAITEKGLDGANYYEAMHDGLKVAIGYRFLDAAGNETVDMSKYHANIDGVQVYTYVYENLTEKDRYGNGIIPDLPPKGEDDKGSDE